MNKKYILLIVLFVLSVFFKTDKNNAETVVPTRAPDEIFGGTEQFINITQKYSKYEKEKSAILKTRVVFHMKNNETPIAFVQQFVNDDPLMPVFVNIINNEPIVMYNEELIIDLEGEKLQKYIYTDIKKAFSVFNEIGGTYGFESASVDASFPIFKTYELALEYLKSGKLDSNNLINPDFNNVIKPSFDKNFPRPSGLKISYVKGSLTKPKYALSLERKNLETYYTSPGLNGDDLYNCSWTPESSNGPNGKMVVCSDVDVWFKESISESTGGSGGSHSSGSFNDGERTKHLNILDYEDGAVKNPKHKLASLYSVCDVGSTNNALSNIVFRIKQNCANLKKVSLKNFGKDWGIKSFYFYYVRKNDETSYTRGNMVRVNVDPDFFDRYEKSESEYEELEVDDSGNIAGVPGGEYEDKVTDKNGNDGSNSDSNLKSVSLLSSLNNAVKSINSLNDLFSKSALLVGNVPNMVSETLTFLPGEIWGILVIGILTAVLLRIFGR